jgi:putative phosphoribosyl transferase
MNTEAAMTYQVDFTLPFRDRKEAGRLLAKRLQTYAQQSDVVVLVLPRGGVPVGAEIATAIQAPLATLVVRKLGVPGHEELAMGAVTSGGKRFINRSVAIPLHISHFEIESAVQRELLEVARRERLYCRGQEMPAVKGKTVILTDDGIATGSTMRLAVQAVREQGAARIVIAVPVAPAENIPWLHELADEVVCLATPEPFHAVGRWYQDFHPLDDHEVCLLLDHAMERTRMAQSA